MHLIKYNKIQIIIQIHENCYLYMFRKWSAIFKVSKNTNNHKSNTPVHEYIGDDAYNVLCFVIGICISVLFY
jgi:hypothetical protein